MNQRAKHTDRSDGQDIDVPDFGPAEQEEIIPEVGSPSSNRSVEVVYRGGDTWVTTLILALLTAGCAVLGYLAFDLQSTLMDQRKLLAESGEQLVELEARLAEAQNNSAASGKTLQEQLTSLSTHVTDLDNAFAKGTDVQNGFAEQLNTLDQSVSQQVKTQAAYDKRLLDLSNSTAEQQQLIKTQVSELQTGLAALQGLAGRLNELERSSDATLEVAQKQVASNQAVLDQLKRQMAQVEDSTLVLKSQVIELKESTAFSNQQSQGDVEKRFNALQSSINQVSQLARQAQSVAGNAQQDTSALRKQVQMHEQAINAIDGTRRQVNSELLNIRDQLNALSLKLN